MQYLAYALPLAALVSGSFANPLEQRDSWGSSSGSDACLAAVTGSGALGDKGLRGDHCASFLVTTVTPPAVTVTSTITGAAGNSNWKRASVTVCPNEVPNYASACDTSGYSSACSKFGYTVVKTTTIAPTTTTKTVYVVPTGPVVVGSGTTCPAASTVTVTAGGQGSGSWSAAASTVTVTVTETSGSGKGSGSGSGSGKGSGYTATTTTSSAASSTCVVTDALASALAANFTQLLEFTSFAGNAQEGLPAGRGYKQDVSDATLADDFTDISDSINFMAGFPLGSVTFASKQAFDYGQGVLQPEVTVNTLNVWHDCNSVTWRWRIVSLPFPVNGINHMIIDSEGKIQKNYAEFDNGAWLESFGQKCATSNVTVSSTVATKRSVDTGLLRAAQE